MPLDDYLDGLVIRRRTLRLRAVTPVEIPAFSGALWHAVLGPALKKVACPAPRGTCGACQRRPGCPYPIVMEAAPGDGGPAPMAGLARIPGPLVLDAGPWRTRRFEPGEEFTAAFALAGHDGALIEAVTRALAVAAEEGLGRSRGRARCEGYTHEEWPCPPGARGEGATVILRLLTPLRLVRRGAVLTTFDLVALTRDLSLRVAALGHYHGGLPWPAPWPEVAAEAAAARAQPMRLRWIDASRFSARQRRRITLGGLVGEVALDGVGPTLRRLLEAGTVLHGGKGASMGFGQLALAPMARAERKGT
ncbi:MAG: CRISPR system precrRNA processing endoribonuclease RAMP protein Cas6 [Candidatus Rokubacteria bacterium]|nr:CRISPR system precrRNA processing endoribonuclease RAMP protein Cas6 [Candidatus Rokubacteria bacterium]